MSEDTGRGDNLTPAHLIQGAGKAREMRKLITELYATGHTVKMLDPKPTQEDQND